jgi:hypothetical protein
MRDRIAAKNSSLILKNYVRVLKLNVIIEVIESNSAMLIKYCTKMENYAI